MSDPIKTDVGSTLTLSQQVEAMREQLTALEQRIEESGCIMEALIHGLVDRYEAHPTWILAEQVYGLQSAWERYSAAVYDAGVISSDLLNL